MPEGADPFAQARRLADAVETETVERIDDGTLALAKLEAATMHTLATLADADWLDTDRRDIARKRIEDWLDDLAG